uniref:Cytochrome c biogenesis protein Ccs1 n=1 Tax=Melanthalia intermedia TaxID=172989 RepID=A0A345UAF9_9FLOR|nr:Cytochrome c biogenesis protein [Melanthalia intermedia]AXI97445.1 Cytochrome c biogenesis protein [Melanthalia intermedia]
MNLRSSNIKNIGWQILKKLANLNLSIILLLAIALISILGTIIEQNQSIVYYQTNYSIESKFPECIINWKIILQLGLDKIYSTGWFLSILSIFFCSLIVCTFSRQLPGLKNARKWKFLQETKKIQEKASFTYLRKKSISNMIYSLYNQDYFIFQKGNSIYGYKGLSGRIAPIFVHFGIILTLIGSLVGLLFGFTAQEIIPNGEIFHIKNIVKSGLNSEIPNDLVGEIKNFNILYNEDNSIKQFISNILLYNQERKCVARKEIFVNSPLIFKKTTFYQTEWQINSLRLKVGNSQIIQKKLTKTREKSENKLLWYCRVPINFQKSITFIVTKLENKIYLYNDEGVMITSANLNDKIIIDGIAIRVIEIMTSTGLQIKTDAGIPIIYTGFFILIISIILSYISYCQVWVTAGKDRIKIAGLTNRAKLTLEEDLVNIEEVYTNCTWIKY